jgi:hypothetical protein
MTGRWPRRRMTHGSPGIARRGAAAAGRESLRSVVQPSGDEGPAAKTEETRGGGGAAGGQQVISLRLERLSELFDLPETDLFNQGRDNYYLTGIDFAISELRGRPYSRRPVRLEIKVPAAEVVPGGEHAVARAVRSYCQARIQYNGSERRGALGDGVAALKIGLPVAAVGIVLATIFSTGFVGDVLGAVLAWVGLWYPLDQLLFYPSECTRENRSIRLLESAEVALLPRGSAEAESQPRPAPQA